VVLHEHRGGKALSSVALLLVIAMQGVPIGACLVLALMALSVWAFASPPGCSEESLDTAAAATCRRALPLRSAAG
jgi:hypothetical protein